RTLRQLAIESEGEKDLGWLGFARRACRSARDGETPEVERHDERLSVRARNAEGCVVRKALRRVAVQHGVGDAGLDSGDEPIAEVWRQRAIGRAGVARSAHSETQT